MTGHTIIGLCLVVTMLWLYPAGLIADRLRNWWHRPLSPVEREIHTGWPR